MTSNKTAGGFPVWMSHDYIDAPPVRGATTIDKWGGSITRADFDNHTFDPAVMAAWAVRRPPGDLVYFDDGTWDHYNDAQRVEMCAILKWYCPLFGIYRRLPQRDWYAPQAASVNPAYRKYYEGHQVNWRMRNEAMRPWAKWVNCVLPSLYVIYQTPTYNLDWIATYATRNIEEARRYGLPVIPVIWPRVWDGPGHKTKDFSKHQYVSPDRWRVLLEIIRDKADGVFWWDTVDMPWSEIVETPQYQIFRDMFGTE